MVEIINKRITLIAILDERTLNIINEITNNLNSELCKVPFIVENRKDFDTLPYHFTLMVWPEEEKKTAINVFNSINFKNIKLKVKGLNIKSSYNNSWNLYFEIEENDDLKILQQAIYKGSKIQKYNPEIFYPYITIHCDDDYENILRIKGKLESEFKNFEFEFKKIGLFEIYPAKRIYKI